MPVCPECKEKIDELMAFKTVRTGSILSIRHKDPYFGKLQTYDLDTEEAMDKHFDCPACGEQLFDNLIEAVEFLKDGRF
jgi:hypothetical protein